ncbi:MAG TPA: RES family NAD+ phosphorylase [Aequorivita sp.]|nr:RES family NAD+ phosphorylase [Aequorivita sp.]
MRIYRVAKTVYIDDLSGEGSRLYGGRWNRIGEPMIYFSNHLSLCLLEILVHVDFGQLPLDYSYMEVDIPDSSIKTVQSLEFIKPTWHTEEAGVQLQMIGSTWLKKRESLALEVPSAVLRKEYNVLINPLHKDFKKLKFIEIEKMDFDPRLLR